MITKQTRIHVGLSRLAGDTSLSVHLSPHKTDPDLVMVKCPDDEDLRAFLETFAIPHSVTEPGQRFYRSAVARKDLREVIGTIMQATLDAIDSAPEDSAPEGFI